MDYKDDEFLIKRKNRQKKIRQRRAKVILAFLLICLIVTGVILSFTVLFPIKNITSKGSKVYKSNQIVNASGIKVGDNLFSASKKDALDELKAKLPFVENIEFERKFPDTLNIVVTDAKEFACYNIGENYYTVSESGWTLCKYDELPEQVIEIKAKGVKCKVGSQIEFSDEKGDEVPKLIIQLLKQHEIPVNYVDVTSSLNLTAKVNNQFVVDFGTTTDLEYKVKHLKTMMEEIGEKATGNINLSVWNSQNTQGFFVQNNIK